MAKKPKMVVDPVDLQAIFGRVVVVEFYEVVFVAEERRRTDVGDGLLAVELQVLVLVVVMLEERPVNPGAVDGDEDVGIDRKDRKERVDWERDGMNDGGGFSFLLFDG